MQRNNYNRRNKKEHSSTVSVRKVAGACLLALVIILVDIVFTSCTEQEELVLTENGTAIEESAPADLSAGGTESPADDPAGTPIKSEGETFAAEASAAKEQSSGGMTPEETSGEETSGEETAGEKICVYVCGAVRQEGVYYLPEGARVYEAVEAAGGLTESADTRAVNQAERLSDGQQLVIPTAEEAAEGGSFGIVSGESSGTAAATGSAESSGTVDINTADAETLKTLPGIGDVKAAAIVSYREANGKFKSIEEIQNVPGIKSAGFEKIKDKISCSP